jgi:ABC-type transport system involved in multi-copper enzyme maturation permease subunit
MSAPAMEGEQAGARAARRRWGESPLGAKAQGMLAKELRGRMRGARAFVVLSAYLTLLGGFTLLLYYLATLAAMDDPTAPAGKIVFLGLVAFELGLVCFLAPSFTAGAISGERERQSYDLLMTTGYPLPLVLGAKYLAALAYVFLLIVAALPLLSIALFIGGVAPEELAIAFLMLVASALAFGAIGLCFSAWSRSTISAAALAYGTMLLPVVALPIVFVTFATFGTRLFFAPGSPPSIGLLTALYYAGGFLASLNPFIAGALTEQLIASNRSLFFSTMRLPFVPSGPPPPPGGPATLTVVPDVYVVGPWLIYTVMALLAAVFFFALSLRLARPTRVGRGGRRRRRKAAA